MMINFVPTGANGANVKFVKLNALVSPAEAIKADVVSSLSAVRLTDIGQFPIEGGFDIQCSTALGELIVEIAPTGIIKDVCIASRDGIRRPESEMRSGDDVARWLFQVGVANSG